MENLHKKMDQTNVPITKTGKYRSAGIAGTSTNYLTLSGGSYFELSDGSYFALSAGTTTYGNYEAHSSAIYTATSIAFFAASGSVPAYLTDSQYRFGDQHIQSNIMIAIATTSGVNDANYTIADRGVSRGEILLSSTDTLTTETAAAAGSVVISKIIFKPNITTGCPFCGSLNSR
jgi:hypothetical protein